MNVHSCLESFRTSASIWKSGSLVSRGRWDISPFSPYLMQLMWKWAMSPAREKNWSVSSLISCSVLRHPLPLAWTWATSRTGRTPSTLSMTFPISSSVPNCPNLPMVSTPSVTSLIPSSSSMSLHLDNPSITDGRAVSGDLP